jgi:ribosomal protein S18 acetylase RimI-like enzyme
MAEFKPVSFNLKNNRSARIRSARPEDAKATLDLYRMVIDEEHFALVEPGELKRDLEQEERNIRQELLSPHKLRLVVELEAEVVAMARVSGGELARTTHFGELDSVWVRSDLRGFGIGTNLMHNLEEWSRKDARLEKLGLYVFSTNERAIQLYLSQGFEIEGRCPKDIKFGEGEYADTVVMGKLLN